MTNTTPSMVYILVRYLKVLDRLEEFELSPSNLEATMLRIYIGEFTRNGNKSYERKSRNDCAHCQISRPKDVYLADRAYYVALLMMYTTRLLRDFRYFNPNLGSLPLKEELTESLLAEFPLLAQLYDYL